MFSIFKIFKKKKVIPHIRLTGIIGSVGKFKQGLNFSGQQELILKAFSIKRQKQWQFLLILQEDLQFSHI